MKTVSWHYWAVYTAIKVPKRGKLSNVCKRGMINWSVSDRMSPLGASGASCSSRARHLFNVRLRGSYAKAILTLTCLVKHANRSAKMTGGRDRASERRENPACFPARTHYLLVSCVYFSKNKLGCLHCLRNTRVWRAPLELMFLPWCHGARRGGTKRGNQAEKLNQTVKGARDRRRP